MPSLRDILNKQKSGSTDKMSSLKDRRQEFTSVEGIMTYMLMSVDESKKVAQLYSFCEDAVVEIAYPFYLPFFKVFDSVTNTVKRIYVYTTNNLNVCWVDTNKDKPSLEYSPIQEAFVEMPKNTTMTFNAAVFKEIEVTASLTLFVLKEYISPRLYYWDTYSEKCINLNIGKEDKDFDIDWMLDLPTASWYGLYLIPNETLDLMSSCYLSVKPF